MCWRDITDEPAKINYLQCSISLHVFFVCHAALWTEHVEPSKNGEMGLHSFTPFFAHWFHGDFHSFFWKLGTCRSYNSFNHFFYYCNTSHRFITTIFAQTLVTQYHLDIPRQDPVWEAHPQPHVNGPKWWTFQNGYGWFHTITIIWLYMYNLICMLPHIYIMIYYHVIQELATCEPSSWRFN